MKTLINLFNKIFKCTCDSGSKEPGPWHKEHCEIHTPF